MSGFLHTAIFVQRSNGKVLYKMVEKPLNKYLWEKAKAVKVEQLVKDRFIDKWDIDVRDYGQNKPD